MRSVTYGNTIYDRLRKRSYRRYTKEGDYPVDWYEEDHTAYVQGVKDALNAQQEVTV